MIGKKQNSNQSLPLFELKELLKERSGQGELTYEQTAAYDYSKKFAKITKAKGTKFLEDLSKIEGLSELSKVKIVDVLPDSNEKLKLVISKDDNLDDSKLSEVLSLVEKYKK